VGIQLLKDVLPNEKVMREGLIDIELLVIFNISANLITGRDTTERVYSGSMMILVRPKFLRQIPTSINVSKAVDSFMPVVLAIPSQPVLRLLG